MPTLLQILGAVREHIQPRRGKWSGLATTPALNVPAACKSAAASELVGNATSSRLAEPAWPMKIERFKSKHYGILYILPSTALFINP